MPQYWCSIPQNNILEVIIPLECKNDTNAPAVLKVWVLEFVPGLGQKEKEPVKRQQCFLISKELSIRLVPDQHVHFSTRALILGYHGTGTKISLPIFKLFLKLKPQHKIYSMNCVLGYFLYKKYLQLHLKMRAYLVFSVFCICLKTPF